jgi:hypothetical protein
LVATPFSFSRLCPIPVSEYRFSASVCRFPVDAHICRTDHEIHVGQARIDSMLGKLLWGHVFTAFDIDGIRIADRQMVGGIFIEEGVVKNDVGLGNGGEMRH